MKNIDFSLSMGGRTRRSTFWYTMLVLGVAGLILSFLSPIIAALVYLLFTVPLVMRRSQDAGLSENHKYGCIVAGIVAVVGITLCDYIVVLGVISCFVEDVEGIIWEIMDGGAPLWILVIMLLSFIPFVFMMCKDSQPGTNKWGPNPEEQPNSASSVATCPTCGGRGVNAAGHPCPVCGGSGVVAAPASAPAPVPPAPAAAPVPANAPTPVPPAPMAAAPVPASAPSVCPVCGGKGVNAAGYTCPVCSGSGVAK